MPAPRVLVFLTLFVILGSLPISIPALHSNRQPVSRMTPPALSTGMISALLWLAHNQPLNGSYGFEPNTAAAASAFYLTDSNSAYANASFSFLGHDLNSSSSWFWASFPEADVPGAILYSLATSSSSNLDLVNMTFVKHGLLSFQRSNGGFYGYYEGTSQVTSSVDTDMALLGLISARAISTANETSAVNYLRTLRNSDGSFNVTSVTAQDQFDALGLDPISVTALTLLAFHAVGLTSDDPDVSSALVYLNTQESSSFAGHVYSAALSTLAFEAYAEPGNAIVSAEYVLSQQNHDGGFVDINRFDPTKSNALDTGWAVAAMQVGFSEESRVAPLNSAPTASFTFGPSSIIVGTMVQFNGGASRDTDGDLLSYLWTFGDGATGHGVSPSHTYTQSGNYTVTLTVTDSGTNPADLSNTRSQTLSVRPSNVQNTSKLPVGFGIARAIILLIVAIAIIIGIGVYIVLQRNKRPN